MIVDVKMRFLVRTIQNTCCAFFLLFAGLSGCGGGGGKSSAASTANVKGTGIRVLHGSIDAAPVDLYSDISESRIGASFFAESSFYVGLNSGDQVLKLVRALSLDQVIATIAASIEKNSKYTLLLYGNNEKLGLNVNFIKDNRPDISKGMAALRIIHGLVGASAVSATIGAASASDGTPFGSASPYVIVEPGDLQLTILRQADKKPVFSGIKTIAADSVYTFFITGEVDYFVTLRDLLD